MMTKAFIVAMLAAILFALGSAAFAMLGPRRGHDRMARALTWRIGLSVALFLLLLAGFAGGVLKPHAAIAPAAAAQSQ
jgi:glycerol uptake facilitator-like aquaporin